MPSSVMEISMLLSAAQSSVWETSSQARTSSFISTSPTSASTLDSQRRPELRRVEEAGRGYRSETQVQLPSITRLANVPSKSEPIVLHEGRVAKKILKPFRCTIEGCDATFGQKGSLTRHIKSRHEKLRPHTCDLCQKSFSALWTLRVHQRNVHLKSKPHKCHICDKSFGELFNKSKHIAIVHEGKRPFSCPICSRAFGYKGDMRKHVMELHEQTGRPFQCMVPTCGVKFARKRYLRRHENLSHKGDPMLARRDASSPTENTAYGYQMRQSDGFYLGYTASTTPNKVEQQTVSTGPPFEGIGSISTLIRLQTGYERKDRNGAFSR